MLLNKKSYTLILGLIILISYTFIGYTLFKYKTDEIMIGLSDSVICECLRTEEDLNLYYCDSCIIFEAEKQEKKWKM